MPPLCQTHFIFYYSLITNFLNCQFKPIDDLKFQINTQELPQCKFNQVLIEENCFNCHFRCLTCFGLGDQKCLDCNIVNHRVLLNNKCECQSEYFELQNQSTCQSKSKKIQECHNLCQNCFGGTPNECLSCQDGYQLISHTCLCEPQKYFNKDNMECEYCSFSCDSCKGPLSTDCLSCSENSLRIFVNNECICPEDYYSDSSNKICQKCHLNCQTCQSFTECLSCSNDKILNGFNCICNNGFMLEINSQKCYQCHFTCLTCFGQLFINCLSCPTNSLLTNNRCICSNGYYENINGCQPCHINCLTCLYSSTYCIDCQPGLLLKSNHQCCDSSNILVNDVCTCQTNQFMDGGVCEDCSTDCVSCTDKFTCTECNQQHYGTNCSNLCSIPFAKTCNLTDKCITCEQDFYCEVSGACICQANHYSDSLICESCESHYHPKCDSCDSSTCLGCAAGYYVSTSRCLQCVANCKICSSNDCSTCDEGFYGIACNPCHKSCKNCIGSGINNCSNCKANAYFDGLNSTCQCNPQYYFDIDFNCKMCNSTCDNCSLSNTNCLGCFLSQNRSLNGSSCDCLNNYVDIGLDKCYLIDCGYGCEVCNAISINQYSCSSCLMTGTFRENNPSANCPCVDGYIDVNQLICQCKVKNIIVCPHQCSACQYDITSQIVCKTCSQNRNIQDDCRCNQGYFENGQICQLCSLNCMSCLAENKCLKCKNENFYLSVTGYCECPLFNFRYKLPCQCLEGYYLDKKNFKCLPCNYKCKTCKFNAFNCQTCSDSHYNLPMCSCSPGSYMEKNVDNLMDDDFSCLPCKNNCFLCKSEKECLDCSDQMILLNNKCVCQPGYYNEINSYNCLTCSSQCQECKIHQDNCLKCNFNRINPQICQCPQGTYEVDITQPCEICLSKCKSCESSADNCLECSLNREIPPTCQCQDGYFEDINEECQLCNSKCQKCSSNSSNCTQCSQIGAFIPNCQCLDGYFFSDSQGCMKCIDRCLTCIGPYEYNCLSCDQTKFLQLLYNKCVCEQNYYYQDNQCNICTIDVEVCQTNYCGDGIKQLNEQCDDWNNNNRDGCSDKCIIENEYYCELVQNFQLHSTIIYNQCIKCSTNCSFCDKNKCLQCYSGYFLTKAFDCQKCNFHCKECQGPNQKDCISCKSGYEYGFKEKCAFCEEYQGLYTFGDKCISKCGDGIKRKDEQCDDGNTINKDGCSSVCKVEEDWGCSDQENTLSTCFKLNIPIAILKFERAKDFYQNFRKGKIIFNKPMIIFNSSSIENWQQNLSGQILHTDYDSNLSLQFSIDSDVESILIQIELKTTIDKIVYQIDFTSYLIKDCSDGFYLKTKQLQADLGKYFKQSVQTIATTKTSKQFGSTVLFILGGIAILGFLMGSLEFYWNVLDNLQILSYITFINVNFPYLHNQFLSIFSFARFEFANDYFNFDFINNLDFSSNKNYPLIVEKEVESNLVINISSTIVIWITPICLLIIAKLNLLIIQNFFIKRMKCFNFFAAKKNIGTVKYLILKTIYFINHISLKYYQNFFYKIIIRIYLSSLYDLNFSIFTTIYCWLWNDEPKLIDLISFLISQSLILFQILVLILLTPSLKVKTYQINSTQYEQQFGSFYEGVKSEKQINRQIQFLQPIRKMIFMGSLILFYDQAIFQISLLISIQILSSIILLATNHYQNILESIKGLVQDIGLSLSLSLILFYYAQDNFNIVNQNVIEMLSYIHVGIYSVMLCTSLIIDLYQQFKVILNKYQYLKKITQICKKTAYNNDTLAHHTQHMFLDLTLEPQQNRIQNQGNVKSSPNQDFVFTNLRLY